MIRRLLITVISEGDSIVPEGRARVRVTESAELREPSSGRDIMGGDFWIGGPCLPQAVGEFVRAWIHESAYE